MHCIKHIISGSKLIMKKWKYPPIYNDCFENPQATNYPESLCTLRYYVPVVNRPKINVYTQIKTAEESCQNNDKIIMKQKEAYTDIRHFVLGTITRSMIYSVILSTSLLQLYILYNVFLFGYYFDKSLHYYHNKKQTKKMDEIKY